MGWEAIKQFGLAGLGAVLFWVAETQTAPENKNKVRALAVVCFVAWIVLLLRMM